jgi:HD-like signal output (HDOD) protein
MDKKTKQVQNLSSVIGRAGIAEKARSRKEQLLEWIRGNPELPTPPPVAWRIIDEVSKPECALDDLANIVGQDPALCAKVLRTVNSVMYGMRQPVSSIPGAVRCLGTDPLRSLVLTLTLASVQHAPLPGEFLQTYWRVSVAGAIAARQLALLGKRPRPDNDLAAGLMRDLGMLVLHQLFPTEYQGVLRTSPALLSGFQCELEEEAIHLNHAEVGTELLKAWRLPEEITEPVRYHHDWSGASQLPGDLRNRAQLLYFASQIGQLQLTADRPMLVREVLSLSAQQFGMNEEELRSFLALVQSQTEELASILQVNIGGVRAYSSVINQGIEELTRLAIRANSKPPAPSAHSLAAHPSETTARARPTYGGVQKPAVNSRASLAVKRHGGTDDCNRVARANDVLLTELQEKLLDEPQTPGTLGRLGGYDIIELLGRGSMGAVFRAVDTRLGRPVAIKTLLPHLAYDDDARARFVREGQAIAAVTHVNIAQVYAVGESAGIPYLVMEFIKGMSLADRLLQGAPLSLNEIVRIGMQTASGLSVAHAQGLVHRDIKPGNLMLEEATRRVKIADFGLVQVANSPRLSETGGLIGTPYFMSPEQADGRRADPRSDMFSLGCVLYTACTGQLPFDCETLLGVLRAICESHPPGIRVLNPTLPEWLEEIVAGLLIKDPEKRFPTAVEMKRLFLSRWAHLYTDRPQSEPRKQ